MKILNLTPHPIRFVLDNGTFYEIEPDGRPRPRVGSRTIEDFEAVPTRGVAIPIYRMVDRRLINLPEPRENVIYVCSGLVAALAHREDVTAPVRVQRDSTGRVTGMKGLMHYRDGEEVIQEPSP